MGSRRLMCPATPSSKPLAAKTRKAQARCSLQYFCSSSLLLNFGISGTALSPFFLTAPTAMDFMSVPLVLKMADLASNVAVAGASAVFSPAVGVADGAMVFGDVASWSLRDFAEESWAI